MFQTKTKLFEKHDRSFNNISANSTGLQTLSNYRYLAISYDSFQKNLLEIY